jgi:hypothetical protein
VLPSLIRQQSLGLGAILDDLLVVDRADEHAKELGERPTDANVIGVDQRAQELWLGEHGIRGLPVTNHELGSGRSSFRAGPGKCACDLGVRSRQRPRDRVCGRSGGVWRRPCADLSRVEIRN